MIVRIGCTYSYDMDFNDYEEGERICIDKNASSAGFTILDNPDDDEALDGREGELSTEFEYELHDGQLCAVIDGKFVPCEDDYLFEQRLRANVLPLSLQTIAKWQISPESNGDNIHAEIPAFQRGLVWNPAQIEVLWDSLLRGIPIGVISLIPMEGAERYSQMAADGGRKGYFNLDGQQR